MFFKCSYVTKSYSGTNIKMVKSERPLLEDNTEQCDHVIRQIVNSMKLPCDDFLRFRLRYSISFSVIGGDIDACFRFSEKLWRLDDSRSNPIASSSSNG